MRARQITVLGFMLCASTGAFAVAACTDGATPGAGATIDGSIANAEAGGPSGPGTVGEGGGPDGGGPAAACLEPAYVNGRIADPPNGKMSWHIENDIAADVVETNGAMPCEAKFDAAAGLPLSGGMSGAYDIQCNDTEDDRYFGFHIHGLGRIGPAGTHYTVGKADVVGGAPNGEVDLTWEVGSRCGAKEATLAEWVGSPGAIPGHGTFIVDSLEGANVTFHVSLSDMKLSPRNVTGKGTFSLSVQVISAGPLVVVGQ